MPLKYFISVMDVIRQMESLNMDEEVQQDFLRKCGININKIK